MTQHPTKEQVESAKAFVAGEATNEQWTLLVELHGTNDLLVVYSAAGNILAAALASAERDAERFRSHIRRITERHCDCGGAPAGDSGCVACRIYHELNTAVGKEAE